MKHNTNCSLHKTLEQVGFSSRKTHNFLGREIFNTKTGRVMGLFTAAKAWRWLNIPENTALTNFNSLGE